MLRNFEGAKIPQRTSDKFFNATEMIKYYNNLTGSKKVFAEFLSNNNTNEFIEALKQEILNINWDNGITDKKSIHKYPDYTSIPSSVKITYKDNSIKSYRIK